ncbi:MAG: hypothetical protein NTZ01_08645 [Verrucomicrobia bacterium]|nr:hypothetical protein [Verrucomicrobiota bacterium]
MPFPKFATFLLLLGVILPVWAGNGPEFPIGSVIQNFSLPQADASGKKTAVVHGKRATVVSPNQLKIEDLNVELFGSDGKVETTITATHSDFWRKENRLTTDSGILVKRTTLLISANGIDWNVAESNGTLYTRVRVVLSSSQ